MPEKIHRQLDKQAKKKGLSGDSKNAYVYGTLNRIEKMRKGSKKK